MRCPHSRALPGVLETTPETPELPRAPTPAGQFTLVPRPICDFHCLLTVFRYVVKLYVVPLESLR